MNRPSLFKFKPGQHVYLANKKIDAFWHPFSIASDPASKELEFYIEVFGENSWTDKLWDESGIASNDNVKFEVMGPYGTSVEGRDDFTHGLAIGAGTGIVPIVSLYRRYVNFLLRLSPEKHSEILESRDKDIETFINDRDSRKGSYALKLFLMCKKLVTKSKNTKKTEIPTNSTSRRSRRNSIGLAKELQVNLASFDLETKHQTLGQFKNNEKKLDKMAFQAILQFYGKIVEAFFTIMCAILIGLTISWNSLPETVSFKFADHPVSLLFMQMITCLKVLTIVNHAVFLLITICIWNSDTVFALFDVAIVIVTPFADWYYFRQYSMNGQLTAIEVTTFCILTGYMMIRLWNSVVQPLGQALQSHTKDMSFSYMENLEIVWVTRSTDLVSEVFPDIEEQWKKLSDTWGQENAMKACPISIYITSKDETENSRLANKLKNSQLFRIGAFKFGRPDFGKLIEDHTIKLTDGKTFSYSLLTFCGSYKLSNHIRELKISNDLLKSLIGFQKHPMEFKSQSYGGIKHDSAHHDRLDATVSTKTKFVRNGSDDVSAFESNELKAVLDDSSEEAYSTELGE